ncbi:MAG TPA: flagellar export chaperone FliS [Firmicutes bacterium]|nr:flagellar export chaperone FliS [Bacillota bacterium]
MGTYDAIAAYKRTDVETATPLQLVQKVYEVAIRSCHQAVAALEVKQWEGAHLAFLKAQEALTELISALDLKNGGDIAYNLLRLYGYMYERLTEANVRKTTEPVQEVVSILEELVAAWYQISNNNGHGGR